MSKALISLGREELEEMAQDENGTEVNCHFCDKVYKFTKDDLKKLIKKI